MIYHSPAEEASEKALREMFQAINEDKCFRLEAGAGAGKTYSLIEALKFLISNKYLTYSQKGQQIACITYTNVAKDEIKDRTDNHPVVFTDTIHGFCWSLLQGLQKELCKHTSQLGGNWPKRIEEAGGIKNQRVIYDLGYPKIDEYEISLHHDDVIRMMTFFLAFPKFQRLIKAKYPIIFIDEYQDTNKDLASAIVHNLIDNDSGILIGLFGDHWQKIYGSSACGLITSEKQKIVEIGKNANFRSVKNIVDALNNMRPDLPQHESDPKSVGEIRIYHSNGWIGTRQTQNHWQEDLPSEIAHEYLQNTISILENCGWEFTVEKTKILMLTNNVLASEQGYKNLVSCFSSPDDYLKKNDHYMKFFLEVIEPVCESFEKGCYGEIFKRLDTKNTRLTKQSDKQQWASDLNKLIETRNSETIRDVIDLLKITRHPRLSAKIEEAETRINDFNSLEDKNSAGEKEISFVEKVNKIKSVSYKEVMQLYQYVEDKTPFSTKHGVKGAQFENVLVVCGRGWNNYNWNQMLQWFGNVPRGKEETFERNRNLFYVACSRPKKRLAILFTQLLTNSALQAVESLFGKANISGDPCQK
ncbi:MAG: AAA family ATPase [Methylobacter sp.]|nr:AAA family ATPase [Methylobacter sp.]